MCRLPRVEQLQVTPAQTALLEVGHVMRAVTVTANAKLVSKAQHRHVPQVLAVHHAVWLTGL